MKSDSGRARTNYITGIVLAFLSAVAMYAERVVLVARMDISYAGLNSLFENTFLILSAFDIGVTTYLISFLLSSVSRGNETEIHSAVETVSLYCRFASLIILALGIAVSFFMPFLSAKGGREPSHFFVIYLLGQLGQYLFGSRVLLLNAFERNYVVSAFVQAGRITGELLAIAVIIKTHSYLLYISLLSSVTFLTYLLIYIKAGRDYPYLRKKSAKRQRDERIERNLLGMTFHRSSFVFYRSLEPVLVSILFGSSVAGLYSNYLLVTSAFLTPFWIYESTVTPTVTRRYLENTREQNLSLYRRSVYINFILSLSSSVLTLVILTPYIRFSFGEKYILGTSYDALFAFLVFLSSFRTTSVVFRDAAGVYSRDWKKAALEVLTALVLSVVLSSIMGLAGIPVAFIVSYITVVLWRENRTVLESALGEESWNFCAEEAFLMAFGLISIVVVWYVTDGMTAVKSLLFAVLITSSFLALWLILFPKARKSIMKRSDR